MQKPCFQRLFLFFTDYYFGQPSSGTKNGQMGERFLAKWENKKDYLYLCSDNKVDDIWKRCIKRG